MCDGFQTLSDLFSPPAKLIPELRYERGCPLSIRAFKGSPRGNGNNPGHGRNREADRKAEDN